MDRSRRLYRHYILWSPTAITTDCNEASDMLPSLLVAIRTFRVVKPFAFICLTLIVRP